MNFMDLASKGLESFQERQQGDKTPQAANRSRSGSRGPEDSENDAPAPGAAGRPTSLIGSKDGDSDDEDAELFKAGLSHAESRTEEQGENVSEDIDAAHDIHKRVYESEDASELDSHALGKAAAVQAFKQYKDQQSRGVGGGGVGGQAQLMKMAMTEAAKLFGKAGGSAGQKQDSVNSAAAMVMKLLMGSGMGGVGGKPGMGAMGGIGGMAALASMGGGGGQAGGQGLGNLMSMVSA